MVRLHYARPTLLLSSNGQDTGLSTQKREGSIPPRSTKHSLRGPKVGHMLWEHDDVGSSPTGETRNFF